MSNIPIVQGHAVNDGIPYVAANDGVKNDYTNNNMNYGQQQQQQQEEPLVNPSGYQQHHQQQQQPKEFKDVIWAVAFIAHFIVMCVIIGLGIAAGRSNNGGGGDATFGTYSGVIFVVGTTAVASIAISSVTLSLMMRYTTEMVKAALIFTVLMSGALAVLGFLSGQILIGCLGLFSFVIGICYGVVVWGRIPFAAANLNTALTAVKANMGLTVIAFLVMVLALGWSVFWFMGVGEALSSSNGGIIFLLALSYYWTHQVLSNTVHVTTAGTVGTWWFVPDEANSCWSPAIQDSFFRATTYSFGSICLGSFLVAIVQALRVVANQIRDNEDMQLLACIIDCILSCIQDIIEYFNMYAYVYVGLYGFGYIEAGRNVMQLFQHKGWTVVISDDLANRVLLMVSVCVGFLTGIIGLVLALADQTLLSSVDETGSNVATIGFFIGMIVGFVFSSILLSVVASAINTVIVCFAESPAEFETNHPQLSAAMRAAWMAAWPELSF